VERKPVEREHGERQLTLFAYGSCGSVGAACVAFERRGLAERIGHCVLLSCRACLLKMQVAQWSQGVWAVGVLDIAFTCAPSIMRGCEWAAG
jgi:hypothetical protein